MSFARKIWGALAANHETRPGGTNMASLVELAPRAKTSGAQYSGVSEMTPRMWIDISDNPRQRDTEMRAKRAKHLRALHPTHSRVNMARLPDGQCYKLDGHTRAHLWAKGTLEAPAKVYADVWECGAIEDVKNLYGTFDSRFAVETSTDQVFGAIRENDLSFESEFLKSQRFAGSMRVASEMMFGAAHANQQNIYDLIHYWIPELTLLDECKPTRKRFHTGVGVASLISFRRYGPEATAFWRMFAMGCGTKMGRERDAVQALEERMENMRFHKQLTGRGNVNRVIRICLSAFEAHQRDHYYSDDSSGIKALGDNSIDRWLIAAAKARRRW